MGTSKVKKKEPKYETLDDIGFIGTGKPRSLEVDEFCREYFRLRKEEPGVYTKDGYLLPEKRELILENIRKRKEAEKKAHNCI